MVNNKDFVSRIYKVLKKSNMTFMNYYKLYEMKVMSGMPPSLPKISRTMKRQLRRIKAGCDDDDDQGTGEEVPAFKIIKLLMKIQKKFKAIDKTHEIVFQIKYAISMIKDNTIFEFDTSMLDTLEQAIDCLP